MEPLGIGSSESMALEYGAWEASSVAVQQRGQEGISSSANSAGIQVHGYCPIGLDGASINVFSLSKRGTGESIVVVEFTANHLLGILGWPQPTSECPTCRTRENQLLGIDMLIDID